jgi:large subunit ribosomal protein L22
MKASITNYRQAPRKIRLIGDLIKGKEATRALAELELLVKRGAKPMHTLLASAIANARHSANMSESELFVKSVRVDKGLVMKRMMPRARGRGFPIHKHTSNVMIELAHVAEAGSKTAIGKKQAKLSRKENKVVKAKKVVTKAKTKIAETKTVN